MNPYQIIIALFCLGLSLSAIHAETLEEAWGVALSSDKGLQAVKSQKQAALATVSAAKARRLPTPDVGAAYWGGSISPWDYGGSAGSSPQT